MNIIYILIVTILFYICFQSFKIYKIYDKVYIKENYNILPQNNNEIVLENFDIHHEPFTNSDIYNFGRYKFNPFSNSSDIDISLADLRNGMVVLDAGCGMLGHSKNLIKKYKKIKIHAITNASDLYKNELKKIANNEKISNNLKIYFEDYNNINAIFTKKTFDRILFIESINYSSNIESLLEKTYPLLKNNGKIYIKTLVIPETENKYINKTYKEIENKLNMNIYTHKNIVSLLQKVGYKDLNYHSIPFMFSENFNNPYFYLSLRKLKLLSMKYLKASLPIMVSYYIGTKN